MSLRCTITLSVACLALSATQPALAQNDGTVGVSARVHSPIVLETSADLEFGDVLPGQVKAVGVSDAGAAAFSITGQPNANTKLTFTLPSALVNGGNSMPIGEWSGRYNNTADAGSGTDFVPSGTNNAMVFPDGPLYFFVGGEVQPAANQAAGEYIGTLSVRVDYF